jgi:hypothetical protein
VAERLKGADENGGISGQITQMLRHHADILGYELFDIHVVKQVPNTSASPVKSAEPFVSYPR